MSQFLESLQVQISQAMSFSYSNQQLCKAYEGKLIFLGYRDCGQLLLVFVDQMFSFMYNF